MFDISRRPSHTRWSVLNFRFCTCVNESSVYILHSCYSRNTAAIKKMSLFSTSAEASLVKLNHINDKIVPRVCESITSDTLKVLFVRRCVCVCSVFVRVCVCVCVCVSPGCSWCNLSFCGTDAPVNSLQLACNMGDICGCCEANNLINQFIAAHTTAPSASHADNMLRDSARQMRKQVLNSLFKGKLVHTPQLTTTFVFLRRCWRNINQ